MSKIKERDVESIVIKYDDGTNEILERGFVYSQEENKESNELECLFKFTPNVSGKDLYYFIEGVLMVADRIGVFEKWREIHAEDKD